MESTVRHKIVEILATDGYLLSNWANFYDMLNLRVSRYIKFNDQLKQGTLTHYELFSEILDLWVSTNSKLNSTDMVVQKLIMLLRNNEYNLLAEKLKKAFGMPTHTKEIAQNRVEAGKGTSNFVEKDDQLEELVNKLSHNTEESVARFSRDEKSKLKTLKTEYPDCEYQTIVNQSGNHSRGFIRVIALDKFRWIIRSIFLTSFLCTIMSACLLLIKIMDSTKLTVLDPITRHEKVWKMQKLEIDFIGREAEQDLIFKQINRKYPQSFLITGPMFIGKTALATKIALTAFNDHNFNCVLIQGPRIKSNFDDFCWSELGLNTTRSDIQVHDAMIWRRHESWLLIFDAVDDVQSMQETDSILKIFGSWLPGSAPPLIIITSRNDDIETSLSNAIKYYRFDQMKLYNYGSIINIFKHNLTPWAMKKLSGGQLVNKIGKLVNDGFKRLYDNKKLTHKTLELGLCYMVLLKYLASADVTQEQFIEFWNLALKHTHSKQILLEAFESFIDNETLIIDYNGQLHQNKLQIHDLAAVINIYLEHPWVKLELRTVLGFESDEVGIIRWLVNTVISYAKGPCLNLSNTSTHNNIVNTVFPLQFKFDSLVREYKHNMTAINAAKKPDSQCNLWCKATLELAFEKYSKMFGNQHPNTLEIGNKLLKTYENFDMYIACGDFGAKLYENAKVSYGIVFNKTLEIGLVSVKCLKMCNQNHRAFTISAEIIKNCMSEGCIDQLQADYRSYYLNVTMRGIDIEFEKCLVI